MMNMNNLAQTHEILTPQLATKVGLTKFEFYKYVKANEYEQVRHGVLKKKQNGIHIRIIISDEDSNQNLLQGLKENFECVVVPRSGVWGTNRMHDKFCIVDLDYIMHGSYNWTKAANYNGETLVTTVDRDLVKKFADEFLKIYNENK